MVMPFCYDGINDMFEKNPWNFDQFAKVRNSLAIILLPDRDSVSQDGIYIF
jgi:hypothetical protein